MRSSPRPLYNPMRSSPRPLADQYRHRTAYEVAVYLDGEPLAILGYTTCLTKSILLAAARHAADKILPHIPPEDDGPVSYRAGVLTLSRRLQVRKTGRTEREAAAAGTLDDAMQDHNSRKVDSNSLTLGA